MMIGFKNKIYIVTVSIIILILLLSIEFKNNISVPCKIVSTKEWTLTKRPDGSLISTLYNRFNNIILNTLTYQVERNDLFAFNLSPSFFTKKIITPNDTIGIVNSAATHLELAKLEKQLAVTKGMIEINLTGAKSYVIEQAQKELELAIEKLNLQKKLFDKKSELFKNNLISEDDLDNENNILNIYNLQARIAESNLLNLRTGAKPEQVEMLKAEMKSIENEIIIIKNKIKNLTIFSPIRGEVLSTVSLDTIVIVGSTERIAVFPINVLLLSNIKLGQKIKIFIEQKEGLIEGEVAKINDVVHYLNNEQVVMISATIDTKNFNPPNNIIVECELQTAAKTGLQHFLQFLGNLMG